MTSQITARARCPARLPGRRRPVRQVRAVASSPDAAANCPCCPARRTSLVLRPACSRKWHNDHRPAAEQRRAGPGPAAGPLAALHQLLTDAASLVAGAAAELAAADPGRVTAALAAADAARRQARPDRRRPCPRGQQARTPRQPPAVRESRHDNLPRWRPPTPPAPTRTPPTTCAGQPRRGRRPDRRDPPEAGTALADCPRRASAARAERTSR